MYLQGRYFWNKRTVDGFHRSVDCFEQAIGKDPGYARAYAGLADSYALMAAYYIAPQNELIPKARAAALKALELDGNLAEAHASLAVIARNYDWDWQTAEKEFRRAIALDPNYATGHQWYAEHLAFSGRFEESFEEMKRARQLDPLSLIIQADKAAGLYFARQYDRAIAQFRAVGAMEPDFSRVHMVTLAYAQQGRFSEALADVETWPRQGHNDLVWIWCERTYIYGRAGQPEQARLELDELLRYGRSHSLDPMIFVTPYVGVGDKDQAFACAREILRGAFAWTCDAQSGAGLRPASLRPTLRRLASQSWPCTVVRFRSATNDSPAATSISRHLHVSASLLHWGIGGQLDSVMRISEGCDWRTKPKGARRWSSMWAGLRCWRRRSRDHLQPPTRSRPERSTPLGRYRIRLRLAPVLSVPRWLGISACLLR